jgi:hypothetical protein
MSTPTLHPLHSATQPDYHSLDNSAKHAASGPDGATAAIIADDVEAQRSLRSRPTAATVAAASSAISSTFTVPSTHVPSGSPDPKPSKLFPLMALPAPPPPDPTSETQWRLRAHEILESRFMHLFILALVLLDLAIVLTEVFIEVSVSERVRPFSSQACPNN